MKRRGRIITLGCLAATVVLVVPYLGLGVANLAYNDLTLSHALADDIEELSRPLHEFRDGLDRTRLVEGHHVGPTTPAGGPGHHVQFAQVLSGDDRYLDIHVSQDRFGPTSLSESIEPALDGVPAYLWLQLTCCTP